MRDTGPQGDPTSLVMRLFGPFDVRQNGIPLPRLRTRKGYWLLALLTLRHGRPHPLGPVAGVGTPVERSWLAGTLWPDSPEASALANLRESLKDLRRALGADASRLHSPTPRTLCLSLEGVDCDLFAFDAAVACADGPALERAVALHRGPLLEGWVEEWVFQERQAREQAYLRALETLAAQVMAREEPAEATRLLQSAVVADPLRESAQRGLMEALAASGNYAAATQSYRELRRLLHRELNVEPAPETSALYQQIRAEARSRAQTGPPAVSRVFQLLHPDLPADFPPLASLDALPNNLPLQVTSFIGREQEIAEIKALLAGHESRVTGHESGQSGLGTRDSRLVTVTGAGGTGKTRLALQAGAELLPKYVDGVWLVELAPLADAALVPRTVAAALGVKEQTGTPLTPTLIEALKPKRLLLLLDNCEHLLDACATLVEALLRSCPNVHLLATSREALNISGETPYRLRSLAAPDPQHLPATLEGLAGYDAVRLFLDRVTTVAPSFALTTQNALAVAQVCRRLDGIPLAIELAAARVKALPVEQLAARMNDFFRLLTGGSRTALPRHQTLRGAIEWSYDLLAERERMLFRRLSVFAGGWGLEAAEGICVGEGIEEWEVLDLLTSLVEKSLVTYETGAGARSVGPVPGRFGGAADSAGGRAPGAAEGRYRLLETVRQYGRDRLLETGEAEIVRGRHLDWYLGLAERAEPELRRSEQVAWFERLEAEHDNLRAALEWCETVRGCPEKGLRLAAAQGEFWSVRGHQREGLVWLPKLLALGASGTSADLRAKALVVAGSLARQMHDLDRATQWGEEGLALFRGTQNNRGIAEALRTLGYVSAMKQEFEQAVSQSEESLALFRELGPPEEVARALVSLGKIIQEGGQIERAVAIWEECLTLSRSLELEAPTAWTLWFLGVLALNRGDYRQALGWGRESLTLFRKIGAKSGIRCCLNHLLGIVAEREGEYRRAAILFGVASRVHEWFGRSVFWSAGSGYPPWAAGARDGLGEGAFAAAWQEGRAMPVEEAIEYALDGWR